MAYIKKESIIEFITKGLNNPDKTKAYGYDAIEILTEIEYAPAAKVVPIQEVFRIISGHSNYHGDNILSALECIAEGKEVKPIRPLSGFKEVKYGE